jgi:hypothetical protein
VAMAASPVECPTPTLTLAGGLPVEEQECRRRCPPSVTGWSSTGMGTIEPAAAGRQPCCLNCGDGVPFVRR